MTFRRDEGREEARDDVLGHGETSPGDWRETSWVSGSVSTFASGNGRQGELNSGVVNLNGAFESGVTAGRIFFQAAPGEGDS